MVLMFSLTAYSQVENVRILKYGVGGIAATRGTYYLDRTYVNGQTDTLELVKHEDCDSIQYYFSSSDSTTVWFYVIYGDQDKSKILSAMVDSVRSTSTTGVFHTVYWHELAEIATSSMFRSRLVVVFKTESDSQGTAKYCVYVKKYKK